MKSDRVNALVRRLFLVAVVGVVVYTWVCYGIYTVVAGMDTMPAYPPGSYCIIEKGPGHVKVDSVIVLDLEAGGALLTRVERIEGDTIRVRHDNRASAFSWVEGSAHPLSSVRGLLLTALVPDAPLPARGSSRGK